MLFHHFNGPNNNNNNQNNQDIIYFKKLCREMKLTAFPNHRYIVPRDWFDRIMNNNDLIPLNNQQFLDDNKTKLKDFIDERNMVLIIYEIMNFIHSTFLYDNIIEAKIIINEEGATVINEVKIMNYHEFLEPDFRTNNKYPINDSYLKYPQFQLLIDGENPPKEKESDLISKTTSNDNDTQSAISNSKYIYNPDGKEMFILDSFPKKYFNPIGIINKSIYCYMISCLQVLLSIPEMNYYFLHKKYKKKEQKTLICDDFSDFISLYQYFQKNKKQMDLPPSIYSICHSFLQKGIMQDSEEFFNLFLKSLKDELNPKIINKNNNSDITKNNMENIWINYRKENCSFIDSLFNGLLRSTIICDKCHNESYSYEPFIDLAIPIPKKNKSILSCLNMHFDFEALDCDFFCENCKNNTSVSLIIYIIINLIR